MARSSVIGIARVVCCCYDLSTCRTFRLPNGACMPNTMSFKHLLLCAMCVIAPIAVQARPAAADHPPRLERSLRTEFVPPATAESVSVVTTPSLAIDLSTGEPFEPVAALADTDAGFVDIQVSGAGELPQAGFIGSALVAPDLSQIELEQDPTAEDVFDIGVGSVVGLVSVPPGANESPAAYRLVVSLSSVSAADMDLYVGSDFDSDAQPASIEQLCASFGDTSIERCEIDIQHPGGSDNLTYWWIVQNFQSSGGTDTADVSVALIPTDAGANGLVATGPGMVGVDEEITIRVAWDDPAFKSAQTRMGFVIVESAPGEVVATIPLTLSREFGPSAPRALVNKRALSLAVDDFEVMDQVFFDVPPNARTVEFTASGAGLIDLYVAPAPSAADDRTTIDPAPFYQDAPFSVTGDAQTKTITIADDALTPGRWYVTPVAQANNLGPQSVTLKAAITQAAPRPVLRAGHYFDSRRIGSSSGMFLDFAGDQWFAVWYAYLEDGTPTWYFGQGAAPSPTDATQTFRGDLLRVVWNGNSARNVKVGEMLVTPTGEESFTFSFALDGKTGSEPMTRLGAGGCVGFSGVDLDVSGHWFSEDKPGFGYSIQIDAGSNQEIFAAYLYDAQGFPRWLFGQRGFDPEQIMELKQFDQGACPTCEFVATPAFDELSVVGVLSRDLASNDISQIRVLAALQPPLLGLWQEDLPVQSLSSRKLCQ